MLTTQYKVHFSVCRGEVKQAC